MPQAKDAVGTPTRLKPAAVAAPATEPPAPGIDLADLKRRSVRGGTVTVASQGISIAVQLISTVILARLLTPGDYGVIAMVMAIVSFAGLFRDLGLSAAAIQKKDLTHAQQSNLFWLNVAMGTLLTLIVAAGAPLVVCFYGRPELLWVTVALSFSFLIGSFGTQHGALLVRNMQFGRQAMATISGSLVTLVTSVILALQGFSYWSLVWGNLAGGSTVTMLLFVLSPFRTGWISKGTGIHDMVKFGANITGFDFVNYFHRNLDNILIGRVFGADALGLYSRAYSLLMMPINSVRGPINAVGFPLLSRLQSEAETYRRTSRKITGIIAFLSMPLAALLAVSSGTIIPVVLGPGWEDATSIFAVLAIVAFVQPVSSMRGQVMLSSGRSDRFLRWGVANALLTSLGFFVGIPWGPIGVASGYAIVNTAILYPSICYAFAGTPLRPRDFFEPLRGPAFASVLSAVIVFISTPISPHDVVHLTFEGILFGASYIALNAATASGRRNLSLIVDWWRTVHA